MPNATADPRALVERMRAEHCPGTQPRDMRYMDSSYFCQAIGCRQRWPCEVSQMLNVLAEAERRAAGLERALKHYADESLYEGNRLKGVLIGKVTPDVARAALAAPGAPVGELCLTCGKPAHIRCLTCKTMITDLEEHYEAVHAEPSTSGAGDRHAE